ncbi:MAG: class I SAM-dependent methyltransferase, partial [Planctomycetota bacterium]
MRKRSLLVSSAVFALVVAGLIPAVSAQPAAAAQTAEEILQATGVKGGLIVHLGCGHGKLTAALRAGDGFLVHGLDASAVSVRRAREHIRSLGLYGEVSVQRWTSDRLPHIDSFVNLLVAEDLGKISMGEVLRVLVPGGVAYIRQDGRWTKTVKAWPKQLDQWTHWLHGPDGNAVSHDAIAGPPRGLQWIAKPLWSRHHNTVPSLSALVSAGGRIFYIVDEAPPGM